MPPVDAKKDENQQLSFEGMGGKIDVKKLDEFRDQCTGRPLSAGSQASMTSDWNLFTRWCSDLGVQSLPASAKTIERFVAYELQVPKRMTTTIARHLSTITFKHKELMARSLREAGKEVHKRDLLSPVPVKAWDMLAKHRREHKEESRAKLALTPDQLLRIAHKLGSETNLAVRDLTVILVGFALGTRCSELSSFQLADLTFAKEGFSLHLRKSKVDQELRGRDIGIFKSKKAEICPVRALKAWLKIRGNWEGPLFTRIRPGGDLAVLHKRMGRPLVNQIVKRAVKLIDLDPEKYGSHSLRSTCVTLALNAGEEYLNIMQRTGHKRVQTLAGYHRPDTFAHDIHANVWAKARKRA